jgi:secreted trypsin-like serine protease
MFGRLFIVLACAMALCAPADAIVGGARDAGAAAKHIVMIVGQRGDRGTLCTATALTRELLLTSAHCVEPGARYRVLPSIGAVLLSIHSVARHPRYDPQSFARSRATADVALIKLADQLPANVVPATLAAEGNAVAAGDRFVIAGFGVTVPGNDASTGVARTATLIATGRPGNLQIRLVDRATRGERLGLGACIGDSGGPALRESGGALAVIGVVSWSTGPGNEDGCGGMTGVTPLALYRAWIVEQAAKMGSPLR